MRLLALLAVLSGCGYVAPAVKFRSVDVRPMDDERVVGDFKAHRSDPIYGDVAVVEGDENGLDVVDGKVRQFKGRDVELMGEFWLTGELHGPFYPSDYLALPRKIACWPQVPLAWLTIGLWLIVPTSYFCYGKTPVDRDHWIAWVKQLVDSAGGTLGVVTFGPKKDSIDSAHGWVVRVKPGPGTPEAPPPAPPLQPPPPGQQGPLPPIVN